MNDPKNTKTNPSMHTGNRCEDPITPKIKQVLDQNVDLSNVDQVSSNAHLSEKESQLCIFEDNEAVIKMIVKGRSPTMRRVPRTHRVALDWLLKESTWTQKSKSNALTQKTNSPTY